MTETPIRRVTFMGRTTLWAVGEYACSAKPTQKITLVTDEHGGKQFRIERQGRKTVHVPFHNVSVYEIAEEAVNVKPKKAAA